MSDKKYCYRYVDGNDSQGCPIVMLWDAQRRAGITDEQITQAMIEKLAVNKKREWPEPKDGEPRLHITAPPAPAVPDGYCIMPLTLTAENGAKYALSGEFKVSRTVSCNECGGEGCDDCGNAGEFEEEITIPWDTIKEIYRAAVDTCRAAMLAQPVSQGYKLVPVELTPEMQAAWDSAPNCSDDDTVNMMNAYRAMLAAAPEGGN